MSKAKPNRADRWVGVLKENRLYAVLAVAAALLAVGKPIWDILPHSFRQKISIWTAAQDPNISKKISNLTVDRDQVLSPIIAALDGNKELYDSLYESYVLPGWGIQESYYFKVRNDGPDQHRIMKSMINIITNNNTDIMRQLASYMGRARTEKLRDQEALFRRHAVRYNARWAEMESSAVKKAPIPIAEPVFPRDFPDAVRAERQALMDEIKSLEAKL